MIHVQMLLGIVHIGMVSTFHESYGCEDGDDLCEQTMMNMLDKCVVWMIQPAWRLHQSVKACTETVLTDGKMVLPCL